MLGIALALVVAGCGAGATPIGSTRAQSGAAAGGLFPPLRPAPPPAGWRSATLPSGAVLAYPADWQPLRGDSGTASAGLRDARGAYLGYLNLTPRQGGETLANWPRFRAQHSREEGDLTLATLATARDVPFRDGAHGTCVRDAYTTRTHLRFVEIACLIHGAGADSVIVAAAPPAQWARQWPALERALEAVRS